MTSTLCAAKKDRCECSAVRASLRQMLVSMQHFVFHDRISEQVSGDQFAADKCTVHGCDAAHSLNIFSRISFFTLNGSFPFGEGLQSQSWRGFLVPPELQARQTSSQTAPLPYLSLSRCSFSRWLRLAKEPAKIRSKFGAEQ